MSLILTEKSGRQSGIVRALLAALLGCLLGYALVVAGTGASPAFAHAELLGTTPEDGAVFEQAPTTVELRFNETVQAINGATRLIADGKDPVALDARAVDSVVSAPLPDSLPDGTYVLSYRIVSADGHPVSGAITFYVGSGAPATPGGVGGGGGAETVSLVSAGSEFAVSALTALQYLGLLVFAGLVFFKRIILRSDDSGNLRGAKNPGSLSGSKNPGSLSGSKNPGSLGGPKNPGNLNGPSSSNDLSNLNNPNAPSLPGVRRIVRIALGIAILSSVLLIPFSALRITGAEPWQIIIPEIWVPGVLWTTLTSALVITGVGGLALFLDARGTSTIRRIGAVSLAAVSVGTPLLVGHTLSVQPGWLIITADVGHLLAGAFWTGGVIGLTYFLVVARRADEKQITSEGAAGVVLRFSRFALYSVLLLAVSGIVMGVMIVGNLQGLIETGYGRTLLLKLSIVVVIVALAAWNRTRLLPAILEKPTEPLRWASLQRILSYEAALLIVVIIVTGFLTNMSPGHGGHDTAITDTQQAASDTAIHAESQGLLVHGTLAPTTIGENTLSFELSFNGTPVDSEEVQVEMRLPEQELGPLSANVVREEAGSYRAQVNFPVQGDWQVSVSVRLSTYENPIAIIPVTVP
ncbi:copper resistance protein CopC [Lysinibacter sp. HNR]|uniref:copper resistance CopC/CopD family protein n=1 Tax=Lysinibacter sp. HNR TaxID=3031408 RepID=UPI002435BDAD|nr:copper resistance protein CopC [Lysinibacter sp. HNR]WGD36956.1 copper resistance protein CopC [Lysinibacter sp. HNR]